MRPLCIVYFGLDADMGAIFSNGIFDALSSRIRQEMSGFSYDLSMQTLERLNTVSRKRNERRRKTLNYFSPAEKFQECVAAIS